MEETDTIGAGQYDHYSSGDIVVEKVSEDINYIFAKILKAEKLYAINKQSNSSRQEANECIGEDLPMEYSEGDGCYF